MSFYGRGAVILFVGVIFSSCKAAYVVKAGLGHFSMLLSARSVEKEFLRNDLSSSQHKKMQLVQDVRKFAQSRLDLKVGDSYSNIVWIDREAVSWNVTASRKTRLEAKSWWFPVLGTIPYIGYYSQEEALATEKQLEDEGWDARTSPVAGYSPVGWFSDPLYSTQLDYSDDNLIRLVIHETAHNTVWIKDDVDFNESFASFVEREGARLYYSERYGEKSGELSRLNMSIKREREWVEIHLVYETKLKELYENPTLSEIDKLEGRERLFEDYRKEILSRVDRSFTELRKRILQRKINNTDFLSISRYESGNDFFLQEREKSKNWEEFYQKMRVLVDMDAGERNRRIKSDYARTQNTSSQ